MASLCLERLSRIQRVLTRAGGAMSLRELARSYAVFDSEVIEAERLGFVRCWVKKPLKQGRPSRMVELCDWGNAKLPLPRRRIEREVSSRHVAFARVSVCETIYMGSKWAGIPGTVEAYMRTYGPRSRAGASASCSRLAKRRDVRALTAWFFAKAGREISRDEPMPRTATAILMRLKELGSWRVK